MLAGKRRISRFELVESQEKKVNQHRQHIPFGHLKRCARRSDRCPEWEGPAPAPEERFFELGEAWGPGGWPGMGLAEDQGNEQREYIVKSRSTTEQMFPIDDRD